MKQESNISGNISREASLCAAQGLKDETSENKTLMSERYARTFASTELLELMSNLLLITDFVRLVDPVACKALEVDIDGAVTIGGNCFDTWDICNRCHHCVGILALKKAQKYEKYELVKDSVYQITSIPLAFKDNEGTVKKCIIEAMHISPQAEWLGRINQSDSFSQVISEERGVFTDSLTGIRNRRYWDERIFVDDISKKEKRELALLVADLRNFKAINDNFGHQTGDYVLSATAQAIKSTVRADDAVVRFGGDEFLVLLPGCTQDIAARVAHDISVRVNQVHYDGTSDNGVQIDIGIAATDYFTGDEEQIDSLLHAADSAMYEMKEEGRLNQVRRRIRQSEQTLN